jgi:ribose transport system substrate-binding protein
MRHTGVRVATMVGGAALLLAATACGGSSSGGSPPSSSSSTPAASSSANSQFAGVTAEVQKNLQRPTQIGITTPLHGKPAPNKTVEWLQCAVPACVALTKPLQEATTEVGWKLKVVNAGATPETIKNAWDQAVQDKPDAVVASGFSRVLFNPELAQLKAMGIPVIDLTTADSPGNGLSAVFDYGPDYLASGKRLADYALSKDGTKVNAVMVLSSAFANLTFVGKGFQAEIKAKCPSCPVASFEVPVTSIGGDLPTRITSYFTAHPNVNWAYIGYDDMVLGVPAAMQSAGISGKVSLLTIDNEPATQAYMKNGQDLVASDGFPGPEIMWRVVDYLLRYFNHQSTAPSTAHNYPVWLLDGANVPSTTSSFPLVENYQAQYEQLWGLS